MSTWSLSRWPLHAQARLIRTLGIPAFVLHNTAHPKAPGPDQWIYVDSTLGKSVIKDAIAIAVYKPSSMTSTTSAIDKKGAMINFHGGGFVIGTSTDDSRWCRTVSNALDQVVFSVEYRMAPEQPFPVPVEDCVDAILGIIARADELNVDINSLTLSGFSAGGNLALASWLVLASKGSGDAGNGNGGEWKYSLPTSLPIIKGLILYYPVLNYSVSRQDKIADLPKDTPVLPKFLTDLFDQSYLYPNRPISGRSDTRLSPGIMSEELLAICPPTHIIVCEQDMLAEEARAFGRRLKGKKVEVREVKGEPHGWDKPPVITPKESVMVEYNAAVESMRKWMT